MSSVNDTITQEEGKFKIWFFPGAETVNTKFNVFTGSYIRLMQQILEDDFRFIQGIYNKSIMLNVVWALNNAQKPIRNYENDKLISAALNQIISGGLSPDTHLSITSSSSGTIVAAQTAYYLAEKNRNKEILNYPFHLVLGASMTSEESELYRKLVQFQKEGIIGTIIHGEVQNEGDSSAGVGGSTRMEAYWNAFGLIFPWFSKKYSSPSFLNTHPSKGHIHRKRSMTVEKAIEFIDVILVKHKLAGEFYREKAIAILKNEIQ